jgi:HSP20 family protein
MTIRSSVDRCVVIAHDAGRHRKEHDTHNRRYRSMATRLIPLSDFDRLAASFFSGGRPRLDRQIPLTAVQRGDHLVLAFDLPGVSDDQVEIALERRTLTVRAERPSMLAEGDTVFASELPWGSAERKVVLGDMLDPDAATASFSAGVLTVTVPISAKARSRKIEIGHAPVSATAVEARSSEDEPSA